jgi:hypothetical protein
MQIDLEERCDAIEACYEFTLSYAAQGLTTDEGATAGKQLRDHLARSSGALRGLSMSCAVLVEREKLASPERYTAFFKVLERDAESAAAAVELVLSQPAISSQLIDNLNASIHLRAVLADLFLISEILELRKQQPKPAAAS